MAGDNVGEIITFSEGVKGLSTAERERAAPKLGFTTPALEIITIDAEKMRLQMKVGKIADCAGKVEPTKHSTIYFTATRDEGEQQELTQIIGELKRMGFEGSDYKFDVADYGAVKYMLVLYNDQKVEAAPAKPGHAKITRLEDYRGIAQ